MLLEINGVDYTNNVQESTYKVDTEDVCNEWEDGFYRKHNDKYRERIKGSFDVVFVTDAQYNAFINDVKKASNKNLLTATFYVGGLTNATQSAQVYYRLSLSTRRVINSSYTLTKLTFDFEEA
ncbi:MAG: hypothetical protein MJ007_01890 [Paludibacteraceae bacterium]|nr:hypothetical protein [Paludibacteraceae bacterium]